MDEYLVDLRGCMRWRPAWDAGRHGSSCTRAITWLPGGAARLLVSARGLGAVVALSVPLYGAAPASAGWVAYPPLTRTLSWSSAYSTFFVMFHPDGGLLGIAGGWYWAAALTAGFGVTGVWYRRAARRVGTGGPRWGYLIIGLMLTAAVTVVPLLVMQRVSFPAWLWLDGQWASGTFALLVIAVAIGMLARRARSRPLAAVAVAYTAAALVVDWPALRSAPSALLAGGEPVQTLARIGLLPRPGEAVVLLPAGVLLVTAAVSVALPRLSGRLRAS